MAIYGTGIDMVEIERIEGAVTRHGEAFVAKLFTAGERAYCDAMPRPAMHYAARFAAKEAVAKAFGTGIGANIGWLDMEITRDAAGRPAVRLSGTGAHFAALQGITAVHVSMSHAKEHAIASAVAECDGDDGVDLSC